MLNHFSHVRLFATLWTLAHQAPLSMGFSRQEYWSGFQCPPPRDLPNLEIEPTSLTSPALTGSFFTTSATGKPMYMPRHMYMCLYPYPALNVNVFVYVCDKYSEKR